MSYTPPLVAVEAAEETLREAFEDSPKGYYIPLAEAILIAAYEAETLEHFKDTLDWTFEQIVEREA